mmetsp:Transcript_26786/g.52589  ORF Transcript_26786/g.52589 Transcript_26786/m.52589 type:complete len:151 (-) Transcript_26786:542-994(-)
MIKECSQTDRQVPSEAVDCLARGEAEGQTEQTACCRTFSEQNRSPTHTGSSRSRRKSVRGCAVNLARKQDSKQGKNFAGNGDGCVCVCVYACSQRETNGKADRGIPRQQRPDTVSLSLYTQLASAKVALPSDSSSNTSPLLPTSLPPVTL